MANDPQTWRRQAACRGAPQSVFFPDTAVPDYVALVAVAKAICADCTVRQACLEAGLREAHGVWGGLSARQRRELRREQNGRAG
jgi:WhiB family redox-sensing transcriptional regulator